MDLRPQSRCNIRSTAGSTTTTCATHWLVWSGYIRTTFNQQCWYSTAASEDTAEFSITETPT
eukprot:2342836-Amphidinium_carterae.1